jgi:hypothetical protein
MRMSKFARSARRRIGGDKTTNRKIVGVIRDLKLTKPRTTARRPRKINPKSPVSEGLTCNIFKTLNSVFP